MINVEVAEDRGVKSLLSKMKLGLLINFHTIHLREGITRIVNRL